MYSAEWCFRPQRVRLTSPCQGRDHTGDVGHPQCQRDVGHPQCQGDVGHPQCGDVGHPQCHPHPLILNATLLFPHPLKHEQDQNCPHYLAVAVE